MRYHLDRHMTFAARPPNPFDRGPFTRLFERERGLKLPSRVEGRLAGMAALAAWLPLLLTVAATGDPARRDLSRLDVDTARYLVALPLLIAGQRVLTRRLNSIVRVFVDGGYVGGAETDRMDRLLESTRRLLAHPTSAVVIVVTAYAQSFIGAALREPAYASPAASLWRLLVSQPLLLACVGAWVWRTALWARLVWCISRFHLRLSPAHPDLAGGLLFMSRSIPAYVPFAVALGTILAVALRRAMIVDAHSASEHAGLLMGAVAAMIALAVGPLLPLWWPIRRAQLRGMFQYGTLATHMGRRFEERWLRRETVRAEALAAPDFSSTTDLYSISSNVTRIRLFPVDPQAVFALLLAMFLPFVPVALVTVPAVRLLKAVSSLVM